MLTPVWVPRGDFLDYIGSVRLQRALHGRLLSAPMASGDGKRHQECGRISEMETGNWKGVPYEDPARVCAEIGGPGEGFAQDVSQIMKNPYF